MSETTRLDAEEHTARNMADALTYLGRVASQAGYHCVVADIHALRDRMASIALAEEEANRGQRASA
ncbi:hypothetical protein [Bradyrhizobium sp. USDA 4529]